MRLHVFCLIIVVELLDASSQILFKRSANDSVSEASKGCESPLSYLRRVVRTPAVWLGCLMVAGGLALWWVVLAQADLSFAFPLSSLQYVLIAAASGVFLNEKGDWMRWVGTLCIAVGIGCIGLT